MRHTSGLAGLAVLCVAVCAGTSVAEVVTWSFTGVVDGVFDFDNVLDDALSAGAALRGTVSFDTDTSDTNTSPASGDYFSAISTVVGELATFGFSGPVPGPENSIRIRDHSDRNDTFGFSAGVTLLDQVARFQFGFSGEPSLLRTDQLPRTPPDTSSDLGGDFLFSSEGDGTSFKIVGTINAVAFVPEPATLLLLGFSSVALLFHVRPRRSRRRD